MFERPHHQRIAQVLNSLNDPLLRENNCLFGGGTAIALRHGEYRESVDIDYLVSDISSYSNLRHLLTGTQGITALLRENPAPFVQGRDSDRWNDDGVFNRDIIDLAMMSPSIALLRSATAKAESAYGPAIRRDLGYALDRMQKRQDWLERCMTVMAITLPKALVWQKLRALRRVL